MKTIPSVFAACLVTVCGCAGFPERFRSTTGAAAELAADPPRTLAPAATPPAPLRVSETVGLPPVELGAPEPTPRGFVVRRPTVGSSIGTARTSTAAPRGTPEAAATSLAGLPAVEGLWKRSYESTQRRPIETFQAGSGPTRLLVIGSLHGNEPDSVQLLDTLARVLAGQGASLTTATVLLIRTPNPDGLVERTLTNSRGVDLNRNFPSANFTARPTPLTGAAPASEVETRIVLRVLSEFRPHRVLHVKGSAGQRPLLLANSAAKEHVPALRAPRVVDVGTFDESFKAGSLEEFATRRLHVEMYQLQLAALRSENGAALQAARALLTLPPPASALADPAMSVGETTTQPGSEPPAPNGAADEAVLLRGIVEPVEPDGEKGYVEMLPPPPDAMTRPISASDVDSRFYELPPAP